MTMAFVTKEILQDIPIEKMKKYLVNNGWEEHEKISDKAIIFKKLLVEITLPLKKSLGDFSLRICESIEEISILEKRYGLEIIKDIKETSLENDPLSKKQLFKKDDRFIVFFLENQTRDSAGGFEELYGTFNNTEEFFKNLIWFFENNVSFCPTLASIEIVDLHNGNLYKITEEDLSLKDLKHYTNAREDYCYQDISKDMLDEMFYNLKKSLKKYLDKILVL